MKSLRRSIKDSRGESMLFRQRALVGFALIALSLAALVVRYAYLQVQRHDEFATRSANNRLKPRAMPPTRGLIFDRNGVLLADNEPAFRLEVLPEKVQDMKATLEQIGQIIPLDSDDLDAFKKQLKQSRRFDNVPLKLHLSEDEIARFAINRWRFPGVDVVPYLTRRYPYGPLFAHVIGYVSRIDADDLTRLDPTLYKGTSHVGRVGLERSYEDDLHGTPGYELVEVNVDGRTQQVLDTHPSVPGKNLYLSIDIRIQKAAEAAFEGRGAGAAVAIDPRNGQVLAMVSVPNYDPNLFVNGISRADYAALTDAADTPLNNRVIRGLYPPGSTVKPFLALGGLELGVRRPEDTVLSTGEFCLPGAPRCYRDDEKNGNGVVNMVRAIMFSTNTYFYKLALDLGIDRFDAWMKKFGFGEKTGIDIPGESEGIRPSREWKMARFKQPWFPGETVVAGIGQGYWAATVLQLGHAVATLANHGEPHVPHLVMAEQDRAENKPALMPSPPGESLITKASNWDVINQGMQMVINTPGGTAYSSHLNAGFPYTIAGKSGTAERFSRTTNAYDENKSAAHLAARHRAWFIAYTPADNPQIAVAVVLEAGAWGASDSGPIVRKILDAWLATQPNAPKATPLPEETTPARTGTPPAPAVPEDAPVSASSSDEPADEGTP